jgi:biopolymer transport protein ExbB/TolQ
MNETNFIMAVSGSIALLIVLAMFAILLYKNYQLNEARRKIELQRKQLNLSQDREENYKKSEAQVRSYWQSTLSTNDNLKKKINVVFDMWEEYHNEAVKLMKEDGRLHLATKLQQIDI